MMPHIQSEMRRRTFLKPAFEKDAVVVVFAANDKFVSMFSASLQSVMDHSNASNNYDIVLLHSNVTIENQELLHQMVDAKTNFSLRFFNVDDLLEGYCLKANAHISKETYYRFLIQDVLPDYDKVLYLDCDLVVNADVADLYCENVEGYMLAAARDADFLGQINGANKKTQKYVQTKLKMQNPYNYFQAGVLLFNCKEMRKVYSIEQWLTFASVRYMYNDQDVLNLYCEGRVKYLDMAWNLITDCAHTRVSRVISHAPEYVQSEYKIAHAAPKIIHYAGYCKPWQKPTEDLASYFWKSLRKTPFYEKVLYSMVSFAAAEEKRSRSVFRKAFRFMRKSLLRW